MENKKYYCNNCNAEMIEQYDKPALILICPRCGNKIATTRWDDIDLDGTIYKVYIRSSNDVDIRKIKFISYKTGLNFIQSKTFILSGGFLLKCKAVEMQQIIEQLIAANIDYYIEPKYPW